MAKRKKAPVYKPEGGILDRMPIRHLVPRNWTDLYFSIIVELSPKQEDGGFSSMPMKHQQIVEMIAYTHVELMEARYYDETHKVYSNPAEFESIQKRLLNLWAAWDRTQGKGDDDLAHILANFTERNEGTGVNDID